MRLQALHNTLIRYGFKKREGIPIWLVEMFELVVPRSHRQPLLLENTYLGQLPLLPCHHPFVSHTHHPHHIQPWCCYQPNPTQPLLFPWKPPRSGKGEGGHPNSVSPSGLTQGQPMRKTLLALATHLVCQPPRPIHSRAVGRMVSEDPEGPEMGLP